VAAVERPWSRTNLLILAAAERLGVEALALGSVHSDFFMRLRWAEAPGGPRERLISKTRSPYLTQVAQTLSNNKFLARERLAAAGLPVVAGELFDEAHDPRCDRAARARIDAMLERHGELVVKPNWGNRGVGVATRISSFAALAPAYERARSLDRDEEVLVEPQLGGVNLRVAVVGGRVCAAVELRRPELVGDGRRSIRAQLAALNADPRRVDWDQPALESLDHIVEDEVVAQLAVRGLALDAVLDPGARVELCTDELEIIDRSAALAPSWAARAARAAARLGVDVAGVDIHGPAAAVFAGPGADRAGQGGGGQISEVNALPALHLHALPTAGDPQPVFEAFVAYCLQLPGAPPVAVQVEP